MNMLGKILFVADGAYESGAMQLTVDHSPGTRGDGLADFIANELRDVCKGLDDRVMAQEAINALDRAMLSLVEIRIALEDLA